MLAALLIAFLCGAGFHAVLVSVAIAIWRDRNLLDIRPAVARRPYVPAREAGVHVFRDNPPRLERLSDIRAFDEEHTQ